MQDRRNTVERDEHPTDARAVIVPDGPPPSTARTARDGSRDSLKHAPDDLDEVHDLATFRDPGRCRVVPVAQFDGPAALAVVQTLAGVVHRAHGAAAARTADREGVVRAQEFEEGDVYMLAAPFDGYGADRYLMDFYDVTTRGTCSRMHLHTGLRFVRFMTGPGTSVRLSSLAPFDVTAVAGVTPFSLESFVDVYDDASGVERPRFNTVVPENSWVDMQVPRGVSHQFNANGPHAVIDSVHPEESIEVFREQMSGYRMMAQTIFLSAERPTAATCTNPAARRSVP